MSNAARLACRAWSLAGSVLFLAVVFASLHGCAMKLAPQGDSVSLDSKDSRYGGYLEQVRKLIKEKWTYPCVNDEATGRCDYKPARLVVDFGLLADGRVAYVTVRKKAEWPVYDDCAVTAVRLAAPFPPVPPDLMAQAKPGREDVRISATFNYVLVSPEPYK
jgi:protein TonB